MEMVSLNQLDKVNEMLTQGWVIVPRTKPTSTLGGPILLRRGREYVMVSASNEVLDAMPKDIADW
jgi:hypothetical protein